MFIASTKAYGVRRADGTLYLIKRGFVGDIPEDIAESDIVKLAIKDGSITAPESKKDSAIDDAIVESEKENKKTQAKREKKAKEIE